MWPMLPTKAMSRCPDFHQMAGGAEVAPPTLSETTSEVRAPMIRRIASTIGSRESSRPISAASVSSAGHKIRPAAPCSRIERTTSAWRNVLGRIGDEGNEP